MQITVHVTGLDNVTGRLAKLGASLHDFTTAFTGLGAKLIQFYGNDVFNSRGQALGETWAPLSASTRAEKDRDWRGAQDLVRTGAMQRGFYSEIRPTSLFIGNRAPYFPFQQLGTGAQRSSSPTVNFLGGLARAYSIGGMGRGRNLPARQMIGVNARVEGFIKAAINADLKAKIESTNA